MVDLWIKDAHESLFLKKVLDESDCSGLAGVTCISLESEPEDGNTLNVYKLFIPCDIQRKRDGTLPC